MSTETKCPFKHTASGGTSNRDWWPNQLNLKILHQHSSLSDPMDKDFNYAEAFKSLDLAAVKKDLLALIPGLDPIDPLSTRQLNRAIHAAAEEAHIDKRVSMHTLRHYLTFLIMSGDTVELPRPSEDYWLRRRRAQPITRHNFLCSTKPKSWFAGW
jgi:integrase